MPLSRRIRYLGELAAGVALLVFAVLPAGAAQGDYYWYVPEHEKYVRTEFFSLPSFQSAQVRINKTQRFRLGAGKRGWVQLEFDGGTEAYIHLRIFRTLLYDPGASDPWYEFKRASIFTENPAMIEARLKPPAAATPAAESKVPIWKRYKEGWSINKGREPVADPDRTATPPAEKKPRIRPLPQGADPAAEGTRSDSEPPIEAR